MAFFLFLFHLTVRLVTLPGFCAVGLVVVSSGDLTGTGIGLAVDATILVTVSAPRFAVKTVPRESRATPVGRWPVMAHAVVATPAWVIFVTVSDSLLAV